MLQFSGKTVVITGASRGIGEATARLFVEAGANVALLARSTDALAHLADALGPQALALACDVAKYADVAGAIEQAYAHFGSLDVLINNAGTVEPVSHLATSDPDDWGQVIDVNLKGVYYGMRAAGPIMAANGGGTVITISSGAAHGPVEAWSHYCASKAGAAMMTMCLDKEMRSDGIRAMGLSPGTVATQMQKEIKKSGINRISKLDWSDHIPPEWPAKACLWMCTADADAFIGQEISLRDESIRAEIGLAE